MGDEIDRETVWIDVQETHVTTPRAMLFEVEVGEIWIPRSQMRARRTNSDGEIVRLEIPIWLAKEIGLYDSKDRR